MNYVVEESRPSTASEDKINGRIYKVGTLSYTLPALLLMMLWLLWGDFCFSLMETVFPAVAPLMLGKLEASDWMIALFMTTIPGILNATVCPFVSVWSDRYRSPLGRRIPFILYTIPFLCLFLGLIGVAPHLASWIADAGWIKDARVTALGLIGLFIVGFQFFNMFVASVYYYLFNDVVPPEFLGRFLAIFRVIGILATSGFYFFVFAKAEIHFAAIFLVAAALYGVVFLLMCRNVKEGQYSPPPPVEQGETIWRRFGMFFRECFSQRFYWLFYLSVGFWAAAGTGNVFTIFFSRSVGLSLDQFGHFTGIGAAVSAVLLLPCGLLSDKWHPLRTMLVALTLQVGCSTLPLIFLLFRIPPQSAFLVWCVAFGMSFPVAALFIASELPTYMKILPRQKFGQYASATALIRSLFTIVGGQSCGIFIGWLKNFNVDPTRAYLYLPIWTVVLQGLSAFCLWLLYFQWKKLGGSESYVPPKAA